MAYTNGLARDGIGSGHRTYSTTESEESMTGHEMKQRAREVFGHGWQKKLSEELRVDVSTLRRIQGREEIPRIYEVAVNALFNQALAASNE